MLYPPNLGLIISEWREKVFFKATRVIRERVDSHDDIMMLMALIMLIVTSLCRAAERLPSVLWQQSWEVESTAKSFVESKFQTRSSYLARTPSTNPKTPKKIRQPTTGFHRLLIKRLASWRPRSLRPNLRKRGSWFWSCQGDHKFPTEVVPCINGLFFNIF